MLTSEKTKELFEKALEAKAIPRPTIFFKPMIKNTVDGPITVYMVLSEKGQSLAVFESIRSCKHYAIRNNFNYHYAH